ncbi:cupin domain-containing protein [Weissella fabalis]|uniref:Cupin domain-containing protein n=2 Tax=Periweissella fabalis TaxID=1070421 RepID=A0A7X6N3A9_9LACO|nr:cupin domain-containing protein [Periweissella fabalis]NKZ24517.1 cupin domain-containing protein [Periweissella fabalis]
MFFYNNELSLERIDENSFRKVLAYGDGLMNTLVVFEHGIPIGTNIVCHQHEHAQTTFVLQGRFEFMIQYPDHIERNIVGCGDSIYFPSNYPHGCIPLEADSRLLDSFNPIRQDFL